MMEWVNLVGGLCMAITGGAGVLAMFVRPVRKRLTTWLSTLVSKRVEEQLRVQVSAQINAFRESEARTSTAILYTMITDMYRSGVTEKRITTADRRNLVYLYRAYKDAGGNGYAEHIYQEMMDWEEIVQ